MQFNELRDQLAHNTLLFWANKPIAPAAWRGITRGVEFTRQCRTLCDFEKKWVSRQKLGLGLMDAWSCYAQGEVKPDPMAENAAVMGIYKGLLFAAGVPQEYTEPEKEFAALAISEVVIQKAKRHATPSPF